MTINDQIIKNDIKKYYNINNIKESNKIKNSRPKSKFYELKEQHVYIPFIMQGLVEGMPLFNYISKDDLIYKKKQFGNNNKKINGKTKKDMEKDFKILTNSQRLKILSQLALTLFKFKNMVYKEK